MTLMIFIIRKIRAQYVSQKKIVVEKIVQWRHGLICHTQIQSASIYPFCVPMRWIQHTLAILISKSWHLNQVEIFARNLFLKKQPFLMCYSCISLGSSIASLESAIFSFPQLAQTHCNNVSGLWTPCTCLLEMCIGWYPCGLKFCKGKIDTSLGGNTSYRCGIRTCRKCYHLTYYVQQKQQCLWYD